MLVAEDIHDLILIEQIATQKALVQGLKSLLVPGCENAIKTNSNLLYHRLYAHRRNDGLFL
ncbi:hypothetical protein HW132_33445 [Brasilonema sp. CT11]|nr:hypothetical protein [Brasilonema sp. CT11]